MSRTPKRRFAIPVKLSQCSTQNSEFHQQHHSHSDILSGLSQPEDAGDSSFPAQSAKATRASKKLKCIRVEPLKSPSFRGFVQPRKMTGNQSILRNQESSIYDEVPSGQRPIQQQRIYEYEHQNHEQHIWRLSADNGNNASAIGDDFHDWNSMNNDDVHVERRNVRKDPNQSHASDILESSNFDVEPINTQLDRSDEARTRDHVREKNAQYDFDLSPQAHQRFLHLKRKRSEKDIIKFKLLKLIEKNKEESKVLRERYSYLMQKIAQMKQG